MKKKKKDCPRCQGVGRISLENPFEFGDGSGYATCDVCKGTGIEQKECDKCNGRGHVNAR